MDLLPCRSPSFVQSVLFSAIAGLQSQAFKVPSLSLSIIDYTIVQQRPLTQSISATYTAYPWRVRRNPRYPNAIAPRQHFEQAISAVIVAAKHHLPK
jgi:hypothetical protein